MPPGFSDRRSWLPVSAPRWCYPRPRATPSPRPFAGFDGNWSGNGTVSLSDGSTERIRCKATYKVNGTGNGLKQSLRCASDSYKFDLSSDVVSEGDEITGNWSETSRNIFGIRAGPRRRR